MSRKFNRGGMLTATTGTGTITLGSAITDATNGDMQTFAAAGVVDGEKIDFEIIDGNASEHSEGIYTASGTTLTRTLIDSSTGALLNLSGSAKVYLVPFAADIAPVAMLAHANFGGI